MVVSDEDEIGIVAFLSDLKRIKADDLIGNDPDRTVRIDFNFHA